MVDFAFTDLLPLGEDTTPYRLLTTDGVEAVDLGGTTFLKVSDGALRRATELGAHAVVHAGRVDDVAAAVRDVTTGGADVSIDGLGVRATFESSLRSLRTLGRHVQVGMPVGDDLHAPIGLPIGGDTPGELAVAILAEIIQVRTQERTDSATN